ncbi:MAG: septal ring lytic transglycosylase RlpA family protein [Betaproteobacteria bacterium]|nr:septal ring lytic transglycosylase RlpA family protein [Betaproteobacteria bacterium]
MQRPLLQAVCSVAVLALLGACGSPVPRVERDSAPLPKAAQKPAMKPNPLAKRGGGFYKDDGLPDEIPENIDDIPDAEPRLEPLNRFANKPYVALGKEYVPNTSVQPYRAKGIGSWYGKKFHGQRTSIGEPYDMFAMTAAHPTLAIPSYVRVTNPANGRSVVVRVTDRGPFHADRVIDLSYTAAYKLGYVNTGSAQVEVEAIVPDGTTTLAAAPAAPTPVSRQRSLADQERDRLAELAMKVQAQDDLPATSKAATGSGVFLQLGAFSSADNAEALRQKLQRDLDWLADGIRINQQGGIHRLHVGPYKDRQEADKVAERIRLALGFKPTFVVR